MAKFYFLISVLFLALTAHSQTQTQGPPPPSGCNVFGVLDNDNDGFAEFDLVWLATVYYPGFGQQYFNYDLSGYQIGFLDGQTFQPVPVSIYTNIQVHQSVLPLFNYVGPGPVYNENDLADNLGCMFLDTFAPDDDFDQDGISNADEDANGNGNLNDDDQDGDWFPDYVEPNPLRTESFRQDRLYFTPNPASGTISVSGNQTYDLSIYDMTGKLALKIGNTKQRTVDISGLESGMYLVKFATGDAQNVQKLIVL